MKISAFWAQSRDNVSPDHMEWNQQTLDPNNPKRKKLANTVSNVTLNGRSIAENELLTIYTLRTEFVIKVIPREIDEAGRLAPIICYGHLPDSISEEWILLLMEDLIRFTNQIGRNIELDTQKELMFQLLMLAKQIQSKKKLYRYS